MFIHCRFADAEHSGNLPVFQFLLVVHSYYPCGLWSEFRADEVGDLLQLVVGIFWRLIVDGVVKSRELLDALGDGLSS